MYSHQATIGYCCLRLHSVIILNDGFNRLHNVNEVNITKLLTIISLFWEIHLMKKYVQIYYFNEFKLYQLYYEQ